MESNRIPTESYRESNQATVVLSVTIKPKQSTTKAGRNKRRPSHAPIVADALEPLGFKNGPPRLRSSASNAHRNAPNAPICGQATRYQALVARFNENMGRNWTNWAGI